MNNLPNIHGIIKIFHLNVDFALKIRKIRHQHVFSYKAKIMLPHSCLQVTIRTSIEEELAREITMWKGLFSRSQWFQSSATFTPCTPQPLSPTPTPLAPTPPVAALNPAHRYQTQRSKSSLLVLSDGQFMPISSLIYTWIHIPLTGVAKVRKEASCRERNLPFAKGRFYLRKEDIHGKYLNILHIVLILLFCFKWNSSKLMFWYNNISNIFSGKDNSGSFTKGRFCMKGTYFYSVEFFFISNVIYKLLDFSTE